MFKIIKTKSYLKKFWRNLQNFMDEYIKNLYELRRDKIVVTTFIKILITAYKIFMTWRPLTFNLKKQLMTKTLKLNVNFACKFDDTLLR